MSEQKVICGNNIDVLKGYTDNHFDSVVTDPPYGWSFMGKKWDYDVPSVELWAEVLRVLKPGGHLLAACGTRTQHRMAVNIEDGGFEIRDIVSWVYGTGFPKSLDISKQLDKQMGEERENGKLKFKGGNQLGGMNDDNWKPKDVYATEAVSEAAKQWEGWGTALKPATELWTLARKPLFENTVAENVLEYGTGGINIDACRIEKREGDREDYGRNSTLDYPHQSVAMGKFNKNTPYIPDDLGRFPSNLIVDDFIAGELDNQSGVSKSSGGSGTKSTGNLGGHWQRGRAEIIGRNAGGLGDKGGASRFFYIAKPSDWERQRGLKFFEAKKVDESRKEGNVGGDNPRNRGVNQKKNIHPTVKPIELMRYLVKMVTPKGGTCLDPFNGSGSTGIACKLEGVNYVGIEQDEYFCKISEARIAVWENHIHLKLFDL